MIARGRCRTTGLSQRWRRRRGAIRSRWARSESCPASQTRMITTWPRCTGQSAERPALMELRAPWAWAGAMRQAVARRGEVHPSFGRSPGGVAGARPTRWASVLYY